MPWRWAAVSASATWAPISSTCGSGRGPFFEPLGERLAAEVLHHEERLPVVLPDVVQRADVGVLEGGDGTGLALEAGTRVGSEANAGGRTLTATVRSRRVSRAL